MNAVIYAKYYNSNNNEMSIEQQVDICYEYARKQDYKIIDEYLDCSGERTEFNKMIHDSKNKEFQVVIVSSLDRFSRNRYDFVINKYELKKNGVKLISVQEQFSDDASGILMESILEGFIEHLDQQSKIKSA